MIVSDCSPNIPVPSEYIGFGFAPSRYVQDLKKQQDTQRREQLLSAVDAMYGFYFDKHGFIHTTRIANVEERSSQYQQRTVHREKDTRQPREASAWLKFIVIFWSPRVLKAAVKFGLAAMIMNKYERIGFAIMMLCFAF